MLSLFLFWERRPFDINLQVLEALHISQYFLSSSDWMTSMSAFNLIFFFFHIPSTICIASKFLLLDVIIFSSKIYFRYCIWFFFIFSTNFFFSMSIFYFTWPLVIVISASLIILYPGHLKIGMFLLLILVTESYVLASHMLRMSILSWTL